MAYQRQHKTAHPTDGFVAARPQSSVRSFRHTDQTRRLVQGVY